MTECADPVAHPFLGSTAGRVTMMLLSKRGARLVGVASNVLQAALAGGGKAPEITDESRRRLRQPRSRLFGINRPGTKGLVEWSRCGVVMSRASVRDRQPTRARFQPTVGDCASVELDDPSDSLCLLTRGPGFVG